VCGRDDEYYTCDERQPNKTDRHTDAEREKPLDPVEMFMEIWKYCLTGKNEKKKDHIYTLAFFILYTMCA